MSNADHDLLRSAVHGDTDALSALLKKHGPVIRGSIAGRIPKKWQASLSEDDVMQQTYADAFVDISRFDPDRTGSFAGWLRSLAKCNLQDAIRMLETAKRGGGKRRVDLDNTGSSAQSLVEVLAGTGTTPSRGVSRKEAIDHVEQALAQLPPTYRLAVILYDLEGHDVPTIAKRMNRSTGAVYMLRARAHERLRALLGSGTSFFTDGG